MGGVGARPAMDNVLLVGDAAGLVNPLQGEGIAPAMVSGRLAAEAVLAGPAHAGERYAAALEAHFSKFMVGAAAVQTQMLRRPRFTSTSARVLTSPGVRRVVAGTWSLYLNGLVDGAEPRPSAWSAGAAAARGEPARGVVIARRDRVAASPLGPSCACRSPPAEGMGSSAPPHRSPSPEVHRPTARSPSWRGATWRWRWRRGRSAP